jgi:hypothetical protein
MKLSKASIAVLLIQLAIVSTIAAKYLYQRWTCPRVWTRTVFYDPELLMRGRYLSLQLMVDGCESTLPSANQATFPRAVDGSAGGKKFTIAGGPTVQFQAKLKVEGDKLVAIRIPEPDAGNEGLTVEAEPGWSCEDLRLPSPVDFYVPEHANLPSHATPGHELWIEVTVPP